MRRLARPLIGAALFATLTLAAPCWARDAEISLKDGRTFKGELVGDDASGVTLVIAGIKTSFKREDIRDVQYVQSIAEQYQARRAQLGDDQFDERLKLAEWLKDKGAIALAKKELDDLARRDPKNERVKTLSKLVDQQAGVESAPPKKPEPKAETPTPAPTADPASPTVKPVKMPGSFHANLPTERLGNEGINIIRVYEVDPADRPVVIVPREVQDKLLSAYADHPDVPRGRESQAAFRNAPGWQQLDLMFTLKARDLYPKVTVKSDPRVINAFRTNIHQAYVMNYCGTTSCHGGENAGRFFLFKHDTNSLETVYTNYFILHQWEDSTGFMIDQERPERSRLIQYGLPRESALSPHPDVRGWRPGVQNMNDQRIQNLLAWIDALGRKRQTYPIDYKPPTVGVPATQPAAAPAQPKDAEPAGK